MADNVAITAGSGTSIAADDITNVYYQRVKVTLGPDGTATADLAGRAIGTSGVVYVDPRPSVSRIQVASAGLTTGTTAYTAGDQLGTILDFANAARVSGGTGTILSATLVDKAKIVGAVDLYLFDRSVTLASDNAAADFSDGDMLYSVGMIRFPAPQTVTSNGFSVVESSGLSFALNATSLYGALVTRSGHTFFGAAGDLVVSLVIAQD